MASQPEQTRERLARAHLRQQQRIADVVGITLAQLVNALPDVSDETHASYVTRAAPVVAAGQRRAATFAAAFLRASAPQTERTRPVVLPFEELVVTAETVWIGSPIIRARAKLAEGLGFQEALEAAGKYAGELATGDLQKAQRFGLDHAESALGVKVLGYRKVLAASACKWCRDVAGAGASKPRLYRRADGLPFHEHDRCSVAPVFADERA